MTDRALSYTAVLYFVGFLMHTADHLRRGIDAVTPQVFWLGMASTLMAVAGVAMVAMRHRFAAEAAVAVGIPVAIGVSAVHLLPGWGVFSDPLLTDGASPLTWVAVGVEIVGAAAFGIAGLRAMRRPAAPVAPMSA